MKNLNKPFLYITIPYILGLISGYYFNFGLFIFLIVIGGFILTVKFKKIKILLIIISCFTAGYMMITWEEIKYESKYSTVNWNNNNNVIVSGKIKENLESVEGSKIYLIPYTINSNNIKYGKIELDKNYLPYRLKTGDIIKGKFNLVSPQKKRNPGGFSYHAYLKKKGIYSIGYLIGNLKLINKKRGLLNWFIELKIKMLDVINKSFNNPYQGVVKALLLGERDNLPLNWEDNFTAAGVNHLLAISGLHIGFIMVIMVKLFSYINIIPEKLKLFFISLLLVIYIIISGFRPSVFRAGILSVLYLWAPVFNREADIYNILGITALINLIINPYTLFMVGFQLTYTVLIMILLWQEYIKQWFGSFLSVSIAAQLGSLPITAYYFNIVSPIGIITNIWAIPLVGLIVLFSFIGLIFGLIYLPFSYLIFFVVKSFLSLLKNGVFLTANISFGSFELASPPMYLLIVIYLFLLSYPYLQKKRAVPLNKERVSIKKGIVVSLLIICMLISNFFPVNSGLKVIFFDVGQGDSIFLRLPDDRCILIDGGGRIGKDTNSGEKIILPFFKKEGIRKIDLVIITHFDSDHALGILNIIEKRDVKKLVIPENYDKNQLAKDILSIAEKKNITVKKIKRGDDFETAGVLFQVLHPFEKSNSFSDNRNDNSIVLKIKYHSFTMLLTGDLEEKGENALILKDNKSKKNYLNCNILKLGHHGSNTSSSYKFLKRVSPREAIVSVGNNNYGHPAPEVVFRLNKLNIRYWKTLERGAVVINTDGEYYKIKTIK